MSTRTWAVFGCLAVLSLGLPGCEHRQPAAALINEGAQFNGSLPVNPLRWKVITSFIDRQGGTMSTLYGNDIAVPYARSSSQREYPPGSVLSLVTWKEREDPHWFGGRIPGQVQSVEFVTASAGPHNQLSYSYEDYEGSPLSRTLASVGRAAGSRAAFLLSQRAAVMP